MAALLGVELEQAEAVCAAAREGPDGTEIVEPANDNGGGQVVISGHRAAVERAVAVAKARGVRRAVLLPVSGAVSLCVDGTCGSRDGGGT